MRNKIISFLIISLIAVVFSGCRAKEENTVKKHGEVFDLYSNKTYGFELQLPTEILNSDDFEVRENKEKYPDATALEFIFGKVSKDNIYGGGILFEIVINSVSSTEVFGEVLANDDVSIFSFIPETKEIKGFEESIESAPFKEIFQEYKVFFPRIKESFTLKSGD